MEIDRAYSGLERAYYFTVGLTVILVSYSATLLAAQYLITRL